MRATLSLPILGAALFTLGALAFRLTRGSPGHPPAPTAPQAAPLELPSLLDRLRERGF